MAKCVSASARRGDRRVQLLLDTAEQLFAEIGFEAATTNAIAARAPHLCPRQRSRCAKVSVQLIRALLPLVVTAKPQERDAVVVELKAAQRGYLAPIFARKRP